MASIELVELTFSGSPGCDDRCVAIVVMSHTFCTFCRHTPLRSRRSWCACCIPIRCTSLRDEYGNLLEYIHGPSVARLVLPCSTWVAPSLSNMSTTFEPNLRSTFLRINDKSMLACGAHCRDFLKLHTPADTQDSSLHMSELSPRHRRLEVAFAVICYVCKLSPPCNFIFHHPKLLHRGTILAPA